MALRRAALSWCTRSLGDCGLTSVDGGTVSCCCCLLACFVCVFPLAGMYLFHTFDNGLILVPNVSP